MQWHYSKRMPIGRLVRHGVWIGDDFCGAVIYGRGANSNACDFIGIQQGQWCELVRVALCANSVPTSKIVATSLRLIGKSNPGLEAIVSYADPEQGHVGTIYQAMNWFYTGKTSRSRQYLVDGVWRHNREITSGAFGSRCRYSKSDQASFPTRLTEPKLRYVYPMTRQMRAKLASISLQYPLRVESDTRDTPRHHRGKGGATPTSTLD